jgi:Flp pilus assembly protein TadD
VAVGARRPAGSKGRRSGTAEAGAAAPGASRSTSLVLGAALALLTIAIYAQAGSFTFISLDDPGYVLDNTHVTSGVTLDNVRWAFTSGYAANWHPLTWISHQIDVSLFGLTPGRHHLVNVAWHVLTTLLLFGLLRAMTGAVWRSAFVAGLFAVHPAHVESVAWIAERKDVLSACFWVATTWAYVGWTRRPSAWRYTAIVALFGLGLMAKPMLVTLPFALLLLDVWPLDRAAGSWGRRVTEKLPLFAMAAASSVITALVQLGSMASLDLIPLGDRLANAIVSYARYVRILVWPADLTVLYPHVPNLPASLVLPAAALIAALTAGAWRGRRAAPFLLVGWLWFVGTLVPVIGVMQVGVQALADRYTYIPSIGFFIAIAWGAQALSARVRVPRAGLRAAGAAVVVGAALLAREQIATWATSETLWRQAVAATSRNPRAHIELGVAYGKAGRHADAAAEFQAALAFPLTVVEGRDLSQNLARALVSQGKLAEAIPILQRARELSPDRADLCHEAALAYFGAGRIDEALAAWRDAVRLNPRYEEAYFTMGVVLAANGKPDDARQAFTEVLRLNPGRQDVQDLLQKIGR